MLKFKNIEELQKQIRSGDVSTGDLDYVEVEGIEFIMKSYDSEGKEIIWEENKDSDKNKKNKLEEDKNNTYAISMITRDRYNEGVEDAEFEYYMY